MVYENSTVQNDDSVGADGSLATKEIVSRRVTLQQDTPQRGTFLKDPVVRLLGLAILVVLVGGLLAGVVLFVRGDITFDDTPQTMTERERLFAQEKLESNDESQASDWQYYILTLLNTGKREQAAEEFEKLKNAVTQEKVDVSRGDTLEFIEATFALYDGKKDEAAKLFESVKEKTYTVYKTAYDELGETDNWARAFGPDANYTDSMLRLSSYYAEKGDWEKVIENLNPYLELNPVEAGVIIDRGNAYLKVGDAKSAKKDFEKALEFMPDSEEAKAGLEQAEQATKAGD
ncbi:MAG: hypothetical protein LBS17_02015 [Actinomycetes bacterium]|jgi:tetratricopeptide (TPR) repeat protein|nr:hypothetical protein [Actinomycetes bacterium]